MEARRLCSTHQTIQNWRDEDMNPNQYHAGTPSKDTTLNLMKHWKNTLVQQAMQVHAYVHINP
jgi:hypothetical protein